MHWKIILEEGDDFMWSDERDEIMKLLEDTQEKFPRKCPCCDKKSGHIFFYRHRDENYGSAWAWCSECQEFSHSRFQIPSWWKNMESINLEDLHGCPDNLDNIHESIDDWINILLDDSKKM